eukprot:Skav221611  [mRNA]  locus=scaffold1327:33752:34516:- [translate_table: standard]
MTFDFELLDAAEQLQSGQDAQPLDVERTASASSGFISSKTSRPRARIWFEIKRFFEADAKGAPNGALHCARELLLKTTYERLHQDGFVQIDAFLPTRTARHLSHELECKLLVSPTKFDTFGLQDSRSDRQLCSGWVGSKYLRSNTDFAAPLPLSAAESHLSQESQQRALVQVTQVTQGSSLKPLKSGPNLPDLAACEITFCAPSGDFTVFQPRTMEEFLRSMKAFIHAAAANSIADNTSGSEKVHATLRFGDTR